LWTLARRGAVTVAGETLRLPAFVGWLYVPGWIIGSVFLTSVIVVKLYDSVFPEGLSKKAALGLIILWLLCILGGVLLWRLVR
jgi:hypothetical protein